MLVHAKRLKRGQHTENTQYVPSITNLLQDGLVAHFQGRALALKNVLRCAIHDVRDLDKRLHALPWKILGHKPPEIWGADFENPGEGLRSEHHLRGTERWTSRVRAFAWS